MPSIVDWPDSFRLFSIWTPLTWSGKSLTLILQKQKILDTCFPSCSCNRVQAHDQIHWFHQKNSSQILNLKKSQETRTIQKPGSRAAAANVASRGSSGSAQCLVSPVLAEQDAGPMVMACEVAVICSLGQFSGTAPGWLASELGSWLSQRDWELPNLLNKLLFWWN